MINHIAFVGNGERCDFCGGKAYEHLDRESFEAGLDEALTFAERVLADFRDKGSQDGIAAAALIAARITDLRENVR